MGLILNALFKSGKYIGAITEVITMQDVVRAGSYIYDKVKIKKHMERERMRNGWRVSPTMKRDIGTSSRHNPKTQVFVVRESKRGK